MPTLDQHIDVCVAEFRKNALICSIERGDFNVGNYIALLTQIFHQVRAGPSTFAIAGASILHRSKFASEYLIKHAEEEQLHYKWIESDLHALGYEGDPTKNLPGKAVTSYISLNYYCGHYAPLSRLAIAAFLEGVSGQLGGEYGHRAAQIISKGPECFSFFLSHGELDKGHAAEVVAVIEATMPSEQELQVAIHHMKTAAQLYSDIYDFAAAQNAT